MITLTLPTKFENILKQNENFRGETITLIGKFSDWIKHNYLEFFPEYTDHGIEHIQDVLDTSAHIINDATLDILTPEDIYVLIASILLHDSAMHIDKYGLWSLLKDDRFNGVVFSKRKNGTWLDKWHEFEKKVKKFEENEWYSFFGEFEIVELPEIYHNNLNDRQKILIGDFIRQHHADIAETIASYGIPTRGTPFELFSKDFMTYNQLAGFIAKSHNYNLRQMVDELGDHTAREYRKTHPAFLMGVLRIADYLQFENKRTPKVLFRIKGTGMCSPVSLSEWKKHLSILSTGQNHSDAELLYVDAIPDDVKTLESIKKLLITFQNELDSFWAVNGEIYSRFDKLSSLGLTLRRVKSNLDDPYSYVESNHKSFYPETLHIKADNQKIFPILIGPLYGDIPQIGLRELLQNSIDACNERFSIEKKEDIHMSTIPYKITITIDLDSDEFIIHDNGIGMDIDVVKNYFLKVGASYRFSEVWKATHLNGQKGYVPRTGKFGIGMLAGFLIGDTITVISKKEGFSSDEAIKFEYKLDSMDIQVDFIDVIESGTVIKITSNKERLNQIVEGFKKEHNSYREALKWYSYWYYLDSPVIEFFVVENGEKQRVLNKDIIKKEDIFTKWQSVEGTVLDGYYWIKKISPKLYCNGILIRNYLTPIFSIDLILDKYKMPNISIAIFDNMGQFPLTLTRDGLVIKEFFEEHKLKHSILFSYYQEIAKRISLLKWSHVSIKNFILLESHTNGDNSMFPMILINKKFVPIGSLELKDKYVVFDYLFENQDR
ncbi:HD domain-containing protein, partial [Sulfuricurvum sp.]|uniref:HD domain-containing protein n=1 Tax=Sulfuricurvum sp. TaxID=2025608 RepID=UPI003C4DE787